MAEDTLTEDDVQERGEYRSNHHYGVTEDGDIVLYYQSVEGGGYENVVLDENQFKVLAALAEDAAEGLAIRSVGIGDYDFHTNVVLDADEENYVVSDDGLSVRQIHESAPDILGMEWDEPTSTQQYIELEDFMGHTQLLDPTEPFEVVEYTTDSSNEHLALFDGEAVPEEGFPGNHWGSDVNEYHGDREWGQDYKFTEMRMVDAE
jgi:hypothetical protein